ncbi:hypothetical protein LTR70_007695 [Exophiala xenobiotica]|uniref:3-oxoacyl-[acyl-carrier-protein] reductase n=1 Tax=Lithohypha guttulata TaxID=1690604 RepID=A0ABR0K3G1_9EURO|nr:hypothetical protein LTR24_007291 [Lithohypha guttulata]KAK5313286.1 hypothetical protein LTR70_007695 [Exophiala xenobiotica]
MSLRNQVALVTGSSRGLGLAIAKALHAEGVHVVINYVDPTSEDTAQANATALNTIAIRADVTDLDQVQSLFDRVESHFQQPISIVVNNALGAFKFNGPGRKTLDQITWSDFDLQLRTTLQGALNTTKSALPGFRKLGGGRIINIGTNLVQNPVVPYQDYTAAKGALLAFTHTTAAELGPENVTCNMVAGGLLRSTDASAATPHEVFDQIAAITPLRRVTTPEELAGAVVFFAGPLAKAVTGQQIVVDGGLVMT